MEIILISSSLGVGILLSFVYKPGSILVRKAALAYIWLTTSLSVITCIFYFAGIKNQSVNTLLNYIMSWGKYPARALLGFLGTTIFMDARNDDHPEVKKLIRLTLTGVSLATGLSFLTATVGKATNMTDMIAFFKQSGYAVWFLYFIMAAETLGAIGVLLHFKLKTGPLATTGLMLIMIGAMYTHRHNKDPLFDSYAAISQFITLGIMLVLFYFERSVSMQQAEPENVAASVTTQGSRI